MLKGAEEESEKNLRIGKKDKTKRLFDIPQKIRTHNEREDSRTTHGVIMPCYRL